MKKQEIEQVAYLMLKQMGQVDLRAKLFSMQCVIEERELTRKMYWWKPAQKAAGRRFIETTYSKDYEVELHPEIWLHYKRNVVQTCHRTYAKDYLTLSDGNTEIKATAADLKKIMAKVGGERLSRLRGSDDMEGLYPIKLNELGNDLEEVL